MRSPLYMRGEERIEQLTIAVKNNVYPLTLLQDFLPIFTPVIFSCTLHCPICNTRVVHLAVEISYNSYLSQCQLTWKTSTTLITIIVSFESFPHATDISESLLLDFLFFFSLFSTQSSMLGYSEDRNTTYQILHCGEHSNFKLKFCQESIHN